jgi:hypothetical protein
MVSMQRHWRGLREFIRHNGVPPDNNAAERALRGPVVGRKMWRDNQRESARQSR